MKGIGGATFVIALLIMLAGCTRGPSVRQQTGPFTIAIFATTDTRGELEPCG